MGEDKDRVRSKNMVPGKGKSAWAFLPLLRKQRPPTTKGREAYADFLNARA